MEQLVLSINAQNQILKEIRSRVFDFDGFQERKLIVLEHSAFRRGALDWAANSNLSYREWVERCSEYYPAIKIEGFEDSKSLKSFVPKRIYNQFQDVHVFISNKTGMSFKWHSDDCHVILYVLVGKKIVSIKNKRYVIKRGEYVSIPKGHIHRVFSTAGTVALSIGIK